MNKNEKPIHVWIPVKLYERFRIALFKEDKSITQKIQELIEKYVEFENK